MALGNIKAAIISFHNEARKTNYSASATDLDIAIQLCLNDISNELDALPAIDTGQELESGSVSLDYPTDFKALISIVLINSSGVRQSPLEELPGGHKEYRRLRDSDSATGEPEWYSEFNDKFWLWRPSNGDYTTEIEYIRYHPQDVASILYGEQFRNCIYFGTVFFKAAIQGNTKYMSIWGPLYANQKEKIRLNLPTEPQISQG